MANTTTTAVQALLETAGDYNLRSRPDLGVFVSSASAVMGRVVTCAARKGITLAADELELVERWLAAHLYAMVDQTYASKNTQSAGGSFHGQTGLNLDGTKYGQNARMLDYSGCLSAIASRAVAGGFWLGKPPSAQVDYEDRN